MIDIAKLRLPENPVVIDCGCNEGQWLDVVLPQLRGKPTVFAFDMLEEELHTCRARHPGVLAYNFAIGGMAQLVRYYRHGFSQSSSLLNMTSEHDRVWGSPTHLPVGTGLVAMIALDSLLDFGVERVNLLKMDLQGYELEALHGASRLLSVTDHVLAEVAWAELYEGQPLFQDINRFLIHQGFTFVETYDEHRSCDGSGEIGAGDGWWRSLSL